MHTLAHLLFFSPLGIYNIDPTMGSFDVVKLPFAAGCCQVRKCLAIKVFLGEGCRKYPRPVLLWASFARWMRCSPHCVWSHIFLPHWTVNSSRAAMSDPTAVFLQLCTCARHPASAHFSWGLKRCMTSWRDTLLPSTRSDLATSLSYVSFQVYLQNHLGSGWLSAG